MSKPEGYHTITPYLIVQGAAQAIEFYKKAFGATELMRDLNGELVRHAEIKIGDSQIMITDGSPNHPDLRALQAYGGSPVNMFLYVDDTDAVMKQAVAAGAKVIMEVANQSYGRSGGVKDPFGLDWWICS